MSTGRERRGRRRRLERRAEKLLAQAPIRRPEESDREYMTRIKPWVQERVGAGSDAEELWASMDRMLNQKDNPNLKGTGYDADPWLMLARRFLRGDGGAIHITHPAIELLERYGYDTNTAIYGHFKQVGADTGARSYLRVGESFSEERIAVQYLPEQDTVVIWRWGEADHDPDLSILEEHDIDA